jgi:uncharacterized phage-associated protein
MADRDAVCDYIILRVDSANGRLNHLKLQKLMYYVQAWHLAFNARPLFPDRFQAWVHGPVCRALYDRFASTKSLYSSIMSSDVLPGSIDRLSDEERCHIDNVLETYAGYSDTQLEEMTHREDPWVNARAGCPECARCEQEIDEPLMAKYYATRLSSS